MRYVGEITATWGDGHAEVKDSVWGDTHEEVLGYARETISEILRVQGGPLFLGQMTLRVTVEVREV